MWLGGLSSLLSTPRVPTGTRRPHVGRRALSSLRDAGLGPTRPSWTDDSRRSSWAVLNSVCVRWAQEAEERNARHPRKSTSSVRASVAIISGKILPTRRNTMQISLYHTELLKTHVTLEGGGGGGVVHEKMSSHVHDREHGIYNAFAVKKNIA